MTSAFGAPALFMDPNAIAAATGGAVQPKDMFGLSARFGVEIGGTNLGSWGQCKGLSVQFDAKVVQVGGVYDHDVYLPDRVKYSSISLRRAINQKDSKALQTWLAGKSDTWINDPNGAEKGDNATITLFDARLQPVLTWELHHVYPAKWTGPELDGASAGIAMEELQIIHEGFL
jgi:phage tail-like protein